MMFKSLLLTLGLMLISLGAQAQLSPALNRFQISVGGYQGRTDTTFRAITRLPGGEIEHMANLEDTGHMKRDQSVGRVQLSGVVGDHHGWALDYFSLNQNRYGSGPDFRVPIRGRNVLVTAQSHVRIQFDLGTATYLYWIGNDTDVFGLGAGFAYYHINLKIAGDDSVGYAHGKFAPSLSAAYIHAFNSTWKLYAHAQGIAKNTGNSQGHIYYGSLGISYAISTQLTAGLEYGVSHLKIQESRGPYTGMVDLNVRGPGAYFAYHW